MILTQRAWKFLRIGLPVALVVALFVSGVLQATSRISLAPTVTLTASVVPATVASLTNDNRVQNGLPPLAVSSLLTEAAQLKANDMAAKSYYAHISPDGKTPLDWLDQVGYRYLNAGENLVIDRKTSEEAVDAWMNSPDHRENILRPQFTEIGVGVAAGHYKGTDTIYVVEEFGTPYPTIAPLRTPIVTAKPVIHPVATPPATPVTPKPAVVAIAPAKAPAATVPVTVPVKPAASATISVPSLITPIVHSLNVIATTTNTHAPGSVASSTALTATSTVATTTPPSPVVFSLAPEFFTPVTLGIGNTAATPAPLPEEHPAPNWFQSVVLYLRSKLTGIPRLWH